MKNLTELFKILADENRLKIIEILSKHNVCGCNILKNLNVTQPTLSHHMKVLTDAGLVIPIKKGNKVVYQLEKENFARISEYIEKIIGGEIMEMEKDKKYDERCTCGCHEGKKCTCDDNCQCGSECTCGCNDNKEENCDEECTCGCHEGKKCTCE